MRSFTRLSMLVVLATSLGLGGCPGKYDNAPEADKKETQAMTERMQALIDEAKKVEAGAEFDLLNHFSYAVLTGTQPDAFKKAVAAFAGDAKAGKWDSLEVTGGRAPGKVRLLLVSTGAGKGAIPFVKGADGWKLDDIEAAFGNLEKELNLKGTSPAKPPSSLASLSVLQDAQAGAMDRVSAALDLAEAKDKGTAESYAAKEKDAWAKTALLYAVWKSGGKCEPFAAVFPITTEAQQELYDNDTSAFRTLLKGLTDCAASSGKLGPVLRVYQGCHKVEAGPRSEYVDPVVAMADAQPALILQACLKAKIPYDQDPVANIVVGAIHGEQKSPFYQYLHKHAAGRGKTARLAKDWVEKMAERDKLEPPGSEEGAEPKKEEGSE